MKEPSLSPSSPSLDVKLERVIDLVSLAVMLVVLASFLPLEIFFSAAPATGGDLGSHFWPLHTLINQSLPHFSVRTWNPGNLAGEPHFVGYFPLPYLIMAVFSLILPVGAAFNLGTILPCIALPFAVYAWARLTGLRFPAPMLAAVGAVIFVLNESYSMWGGNFLSTLSGEFAHVYAIDLFLLGTGLVALEIRRGWLPLGSGLAFAATALSHAYLFIGVPAILLASWLFLPFQNGRKRLTTCLSSGLAALLLSAWFIVPMADNAPWTTPYAVAWDGPGLWAKAWPSLFYVWLAAMPVSLFLVRRGGARAECLRLLLFWLMPVLFYLAGYFFFPAFGLVDARAFPEMLLFSVLLAGALLGVCLRSHDNVLVRGLLIGIVALSLWAGVRQADLAGEWMKWSYSGWEHKPLYRPLMALADHLRGSFSDPRVAFEHSELSRDAGTVRVFEMLPYFAGRATLESCYLQASVLAPEVFDLQAEISKRPSCPFREFECPRYDVNAAAARLDLLGVGNLILVTPEVVGQARRSGALREDGRFGPWYLFTMRRRPALVGFFDKKPVPADDPRWDGRFKVRGRIASSGMTAGSPVPRDDWKELFYQWFIRYDGGQPMMALLAGPGRVPDGLLLQGESFWQAEHECEASVKPEFGRLVLSTNCPGRPHYLKFSFHPQWRADTGDQIFMVSPGFLALVPSQRTVVLTFGESPLWRAAAAVSLICLLSMLVLVIRRGSARILKG